jgi:hypothetical protein
LPPGRATRSASGTSPKYGLVVTFTTLSVAWLYVWLRYFVLV